MLGSWPLAADLIYVSECFCPSPCLSPPPASLVSLLCGFDNATQPLWAPTVSSMSVSSRRRRLRLQFCTCGDINITGNQLSLSHLPGVLFIICIVLAAFPSGSRFLPFPSHFTTTGNRRTRLCAVLVGEEVKMAPWDFVGVLEGPLSKGGVSEPVAAVD